MDVVDREVETVKTVTVVQHHTKKVEVPCNPRTVADWVALLEDLSKLVGSGRIYDRAMPELVPAVQELIGAINRRHRRK